jgi:hypothetical protein
VLLLKSCGRCGREFGSFNGTGVADTELCEMLIKMSTRGANNIENVASIVSFTLNAFSHNNLLLYTEPLL